MNRYDPPPPQPPKNVQSFDFESFMIGFYVGMIIVVILILFSGVVR